MSAAPTPTPPAETTAPSPMPADLLALGWRLRRDNSTGNYFAENERLELKTPDAAFPGAAVIQARVMQKKYDAGAYGWPAADASPAAGEEPSEHADPTGGTAADSLPAVPNDLAAQGWDIARTAGGNYFAFKAEAAGLQTMADADPEQVFVFARGLQWGLENHTIRVLQSTDLPKDVADGTDATEGPSAEAQNPDATPALPDKADEPVHAANTTLTTREEVSLDRIRTDGGTQARVGFNEGVVEEYAAGMRAGDTFPPGTLFFDGVDYWLADGLHRERAARRAGLTSLVFDVRRGTRRDAVLFSVGANANHGLRRTNADKRRAVKMLLADEEWSKWSNHEVGRQCGVSHELVARVREELSGNRCQMETTARRGDSTYIVNTAGFSAAREERDAPAQGDQIDEPPPSAGGTPTEPSGDEPRTENSGAPEGAPAIALRPDAEEAEPSIKVSDRRRFADATSTDTAAPAKTEAQAEKKPAAAPVEELLQGRPLVVTYSYTPFFPGKVSVGVRIGDDVTETAFDLLESSKIRHTSERVQEMIAEQIVAADKRTKEEKKAAPSKKTSVKNTAVKTSSAAKKRSAPAKKSPAKSSKPPARKQPAAKKGRK